jgi:hypothetical protein
LRRKSTEISRRTFRDGRRGAFLNWALFDGRPVGIPAVIAVYD